MVLDGSPRHVAPAALGGRVGSSRDVRLAADRLRRAAANAAEATDGVTGPLSGWFDTGRADTDALLGATLHTLAAAGTALEGALAATAQALSSAADHYDAAGGAAGPREPKLPPRQPA